MPQPSERTQVAMEAARCAGKILLEGYHSHLEIKQKSSPLDLVTQYDEMAEACVIETIAKHFPHDSFLGEEGGIQQRDDNEAIWIIDALDGTLNFTRQIPAFCVSLSFIQGGAIQLGVIHIPMTGDIYVAEKGMGAYVNEYQIRCSTIDDLERAIVSVGVHQLVEPRTNRFIGHMTEIIQSGASLRRSGSASIDLAYVAAGKIESYAEPNLYGWDFAAGLILIKEAGGRATFLDTEQMDIFRQQTVILSNSNLHDKLLYTFKEGTTYEYH
ncbi:MAG: Inositol-1-monophosphatase [Chlamydiia bacterium]|nr:Inositol-1-monophosphatase [Chlamydiia bacterium]